jgi:geranylgeranyl pyrophosphate synthase
MDLLQPVDGMKEQLDAALNHGCDQVLDGDVACHRLVEAMKYAVLSGGKRLRPALCIAAFLYSGGSSSDFKRALPASVACEFIHTASLILDDLPCMDDDVLRRGHPTVHVVYGESTAMMVASSLVLRAFKMVMVGMGCMGDPPTLVLRILWVLLSAAEGMAHGQMLDLELTMGKPENNASEDMVRTIHNGKTMALIAAAVMCGAMLANANEPIMHQMRVYGQALGLAFQIADDVQDEIKSTRDMGKACGKDADAGKPTYVQAVGLEESRAKVVELVGNAIDALEGPRCQSLIAIARKIERSVEA